MIYLVQIPESYETEIYDSIADSLFKNERLNQKYELIVTTYSGDEVKHTVLGDSFNKELYEAKVFKDAVFRMLRDNDVVTSCIMVGGNVKLSDKYGFDIDSAENAVMDIIVRFYNQISQISTLNEQNEQLNLKIKSLSL